MNALFTACTRRRSRAFRRATKCGGFSLCGTWRYEDFELEERLKPRLPDPTVPFDPGEEFVETLLLLLVVLFAPAPTAPEIDLVITIAEVFGGPWSPLFRLLVLMVEIVSTGCCCCCCCCCCAGDGCVV